MNIHTMAQLRHHYNSLKTKSNLEMHDAFEIIFKCNDFNKDNVNQLMIYLAMRLMNAENRIKDLEERFRF